MARQARAKLDRKGLHALGIDKLIDILLEEASANKPLKARLQTALAGEAGPAEMARLIDRRLDLIDQATTRINKARAKDLAVDFAGLTRSILSELGGSDPLGAAERILRFLALRFPISSRLVVDSARLWKVFDDAEIAALDLIQSLAPADQVSLVPLIEKLRLRDRYGEHIDFLQALVTRLSGAAAGEWTSVLAATVASEPGKFGALDLLQRLALHRGDVDAYVELENRKPENRRDSLAIARLLFDKQRYQDALDWLKLRPKPIRLLSVNGVMASVGPEFDERERRLLEADVLEKLKRKDDAQALRWQEFADTLDPAILRLYLSKLDDFAEFDEMDRALLLVHTSEDIYSALEFLIAWPRLDLAVRHVFDNEHRWDGRHTNVLLPAADTLSEVDPLAATLLYRTIVSDVLKLAMVSAYDDAAAALIALNRLEPRLPENSGFTDHRSFMTELRRLHARKQGFWGVAPGGSL